MPNLLPRSTPDHPTFFCVCWDGVFSLYGRVNISGVSWYTGTMDNTDTEETSVEIEGLGYDPIAILEATMEGKLPPKSYLSRDPDGDDDSLTMLKSSRPRDMPEIGHLKDAIVTSPDGRPEVIVPPGGRIVIERRASVIDGAPWLDTKVYDVRGVDQEAGILKLWDPELHHHARENWFVGLSVGSRYKLPPAKGRWDVAPKVKPVPVAVAPTLTPAGEPGAKPRRGRPPGTKNRSKDVIAAEKAERAAAKAGKRGRKSKKAGVA